MRNKLSPSTDMIPFRQGDLDGLCGIYVIINCVRFLCPEANSKFLGKLFRVLVQSLEREVDKPLTVLWRGIEQPVLLGLIECCIAYVRKKFGIKLRVKLPRRPLRKAKSVAKIWRGVGKSVSKKRVAILSIEGFISHWTAVCAVTPKTMRLFDSSGQRVLRSSCCSVARKGKRYHLDPRGIVFFERISREKNQSSV